MTARSRNMQLFALKDPPPDRVEVAGADYRLVRVFKHDFYAMTSLYEAVDPDSAPVPKVVVKCGRMQSFCGLPLDTLGRWQREHEQSIYNALSGVQGIPRWMGLVGQWGYAIEYIDAVPLDHVTKPPPGFFDRLRELFDTVHARGVAYADSNKRSNILVGDDGQPYLIDFQISFLRDQDLVWPLSAIVRRFGSYIVEKDIYHLYKHKRRIVPEELRPQEEAISRRRSGVHRVHRALAKPYRALRRRFLKGQYQSGRLVSPSEEMESHHQPEKATWRQDADA